jgi:hypothetical protein
MQSLAWAIAGFAMLAALGADASKAKEAGR